jgi:hypothetical protein
LANVEIVTPAIDSELLKSWAQREQKHLDLEVQADVDLESDAFVVLIRHMFCEADLILIDRGPEI